MKTVLELVAERAASDIRRIFPKSRGASSSSKAIKDLVAQALIGKPYAQAVQHVRERGEGHYSRPVPFMDSVPDYDGEFNLGVAIADAFAWLQFELVATRGSLAKVRMRRPAPIAFLVRTSLAAVRRQTIEDPQKRAFAGIVMARDYDQLLGELGFLADLKGSWEYVDFEYALAGEGDAIGAHVTVDPEDRIYLKKRRKWLVPSVDATRKRAALSHSVTGIYQPDYEERVWVPLLLDEQEWYLKQ